MVTNNGGRDVVIHKVSVRGQQSQWTDVFYSAAVKTDDLTIELNYTAAPVAVGNNLGLADTAHQANNTSLILPSGNTMVIYFNSPDSIGINDIGLTVSISLHSSEAVYYSEVNIQATP
jgi:hypothetical protein